MKIHLPSINSRKINRKLAFFGLYPSFSYNRIGGTNSIIRRLSIELVTHWNVEVDYILYGGLVEPGVKNEEIHIPGLRTRYFSTLEEALDALTNYENVVTIYLPLKDLFIYAYFRVLHKNKIYFHMLYQSWPDSFLKREVGFLLDRLISFNGELFAVSPRLAHCVKRWNHHSRLLWPPVPSYYYMSLGEKKCSEDIRVTFLGRVDPGKGVLEVIEIFNALADVPHIKLSFYGMYWENDPVGVELHKQLLAQKRFSYFPLKWTDYSDNTEHMVGSVLHDTDIFIQPYRKLSSTIDTPLLILEAMASLCAVITRPFGNIPFIYGSSPCLIDEPNISQKAIDLILSAKEWLNSERQRISYQNYLLNFDTPSVVKCFIQSIGDINSNEKKSRNNL